MINGYGKPVFHILTSAGVFIKEIELPECNIRGSVADSIELSQQVHELDSGEITIKDEGIRKKFVLDYTDFITDTGKEYIDEIIKYQFEKKRLMFFPRSNAPQLKIEVLILKGYTCKQCMNSSLNTGYEGIELELTSKYLLLENPNIDIDNLTMVSENTTT